MLGPTVFAHFHIDVVVGTVMSQVPDCIPPIIPIEIIGLIRPHYQVFPLVDHLSDKLLATICTHKVGDQDFTSTRVKDLVDMALLLTTQRFSGPAMCVALATGAAHQAVHLPETFTVPSEKEWRRKYPRVAADAPTAVPTFDEAVAIASRFWNPVLDRTLTTAHWDPTAMT